MRSFYQTVALDAIRGSRARREPRIIVTIYAHSGICKGYSEKCGSVAANPEHAQLGARPRPSSAGAVQGMLETDVCRMTSALPAKDAGDSR